MTENVYKWSITNFPLSLFQEDFELSSPNFWIANATWRMGLFKETPNNRLAIGLYQVLPGECQLVDYRISIENSYGISYYTLRSRYDFTRNHLIIPLQYAKWFLQEKLQECFPGRTVVVRVEINQEQAPIREPESRQEDDYTTKISRELASLCLKNKLSDIVLISMDGQRLPAHKLILALCSPYFSNIFESGERREVQVNIDGITLEQILHYMYSKEFRKNSIHYFKLLQAANTFGMADFSQWCKNRILSSLDRETIYDALKFAFGDYQEKEMQQACISYLKQNANQAFFALELWKSFGAQEQNKDMDIKILKGLVQELLIQELKPQTKTS